MNHDSVRRRRRSTAHDQQVLSPRVTRGSARSPISVYGLATCARTPPDVVYYAIVALAMVRGDWHDGGSALERASVDQLTGARRLLDSVADECTAGLRAEPVAAAALLAAEYRRRGPAPRRRSVPR